MGRVYYEDHLLYLIGIIYAVSLHSNTDSYYNAFYTFPLKYSYLIIINNLAITQNLRSRWRVKRFRCQVTKVKDIKILIGYPRY